MPVTSYQFLPWVRRGLAVALDTPDSMGALAARGSASVGVALAGAAAGTAIEPLRLRLHGPGDVIGIDPRLVVRTDPKPNATNFEPNYLAIIDFDPPDFPWLLTPAKANGDDRLRPWLVLVVLDRAKVKRPRLQAPALLPSVRIAAGDVASELPPLGESWSWAHAQVVSEAAAADTAGIQRDLQQDARRNCSRLVCPRRLQPGHDYVACLVPAFEPGRLRGLGLAGTNNPSMDTLAPAWGAGQGDVVLPVYHHWEFSTGPAGDFESLARRLRTPGSYKGTPVEAELAAVGTAPMAVDDLLNGATPGLTTTMEGALVPIKYVPGQPPPATQAESLAIIVNTPAGQVDNPVLDEPDGTVRRLEVKAPVAGAWHARRHAVQPPQLPDHWLAGLNLNPRYRAAAGYGYEVVRKFQDEYVDACWDQIGDIRAAELRFNLTRLAIEVQLAIKRRHFDPLPPARLLQLMGPALARIEAVGPTGPVLRLQGQVASIGGQLDRSSLPAALMETALRRAVSPQRRALRLGARLAGATTRLAAVTTGYLGQMAVASRKGDAFAVNRYVPDGILGTRLLDGIRLDRADAVPVDLTPLGFGRRFTIGQLKQVVSRGTLARSTFETRGVPVMKPAANAKGVFVDQHVERFGAMVSTSPVLTASDWGTVTTQLEQFGRKGAEGVLFEVEPGGVLQFGALAFDAASGVFKLDKTPVRIGLDQRVIARGAVPAPRRVAAAGPLGRVRLSGRASNVDTGALINALPVNTLGTALQSAAELTMGRDFRIDVTRPPVSTVPDRKGVTLAPPLAQAEVKQRFERATVGIQQQWADPYAAQRVTVQAVDFGLAQAAQIVRARSDPQLTLPARLAEAVSIAGTAVSGTSAASPFTGRFLLAGDLAREQRYVIPRFFDRVMAWPRLRGPMYEDLAAYDPEAFMPGVGRLPQDLIMLVQVNQYFIDSFMVGANHEMNRELLWRGFPTDLRGTPFQRFWGRLAAGPDGEALPVDDMAPIHQWGAQPLGQRTDPNLTDPNRIALLVRGQLLRRYPNALVYAWRRDMAAAADKSQLMKQADGTPKEEWIETPIFGGRIAPDITFFGFDIDKEKIHEWCFVLEEPMSEPRFGFDVDEPAGGGGAGATTIGPKRRIALQAALARAQQETGPLVARSFNPYKALSWSHLGVAAGGFATLGALGFQGRQPPFADFPSLSPTPTSAEIAKALIQEPFRAYYIGADLKS